MGKNGGTNFWCNQCEAYRPLAVQNSVAISVTQSQNLNGLYLSDDIHWRRRIKLCSHCECEIETAEMDASFLNELLSLRKVGELQKLQKSIREFAIERDWEQFHTVKNLILAMSGELGELASVVQWISDIDSLSLEADPKLKAAFEEEVADIFIYLLRLVDVSNVDLIKVAQEKMKENALRYTLEKAKGNTRKQEK